MGNSSICSCLRTVSVLLSSPKEYLSFGLSLTPLTCHLTGLHPCAPGTPPPCSLSLHVPSEVSGSPSKRRQPGWQRNTSHTLVRISAQALALVCASHNASRARADYRPTARKPDANGPRSWLPRAQTSPRSGLRPSQGATKPTSSTVALLALATACTASPPTLRAGRELPVTPGIAYCNPGAKQLPGCRDTGVPRAAPGPTAPQH